MNRSKSTTSKINLRKTKRIQRAEAIFEDLLKLHKSANNDYTVNSLKALKSLVL